VESIQADGGTITVTTTTITNHSDSGMGSSAQSGGGSANDTNGGEDGGANGTNGGRDGGADGTNGGRDGGANGTNGGRDGGANGTNGGGDSGANGTNGVGDGGADGTNGGGDGGGSSGDGANGGSNISGDIDGTNGNDTDGDNNGNKNINDDDSEVLYIGDVVANAALMDDLARCLDKEYRVLNNWKHMACNLKIPLEIQKGFEIYFELSPTVHLFPFLSTLNEPGREPLTVGKLKAALKDIHRNDLIENFRSKSCLSLFAIDPTAGSVHQTVMD